MTRYFELRTSPHYPATTIGADIARHLEVRQYLGTAVVICQSPFAMLSVVRKQWMHLTRSVQNQRASTLNAEDILRFTHAIIHMQQMQFAAKTPLDHPEAHVYFVTPEELTVLPPHCFSVYLTAAFAQERLQALLNEGLAHGGMVINYNTQLDLTEIGLHPKHELEARVTDEWQRLTDLLSKWNIHPAQLLPEESSHIEETEEALDTLLNASNEFLREASRFQHLLHLAQPLLNITAQQQKQFHVVAKLAHRVQALSPSPFSEYILKNFGHNDPYFLRDSSTDTFAALLRYQLPFALALNDVLAEETHLLPQFTPTALESHTLLNPHVRAV